MLSIKNIQSVPKNKFIEKIVSYLTLAEKYLGQVLGSEQSCQCDLSPTYISYCCTNFNSITFTHTNGIHFKYFQMSTNINTFKTKITVLFRLHSQVEQTHKDNEIWHTDRKAIASQ